MENQLSKPPDKEIMNKIKELNPLVKVGVFNEEEDDLIRKYWSKFQKVYNFKIILYFICSIFHNLYFLYYFKYLFVMKSFKIS